jgi:hypothetical protein
MKWPTVAAAVHDKVTVQEMQAKKGVKLEKEKFNQAKG